MHERAKLILFYWIRMPLDSRIILYLKTLSIGSWSRKDMGVASIWKGHAHLDWKKPRFDPMIKPRVLTSPTYFGLSPNLLWTYRRIKWTRKFALRQNVVDSGSAGVTKWHQLSLQKLLTWQVDILRRYTRPKRGYLLKVTFETRLDLDALYYFIKF